MLLINHHMRLAFLLCIWACGLTVGTGCGYGSAGVAAAVGGSGGGSGGGGNSAASLSDVVIEARTSPATIRFTLTDAESNSVDVELNYQDPVTGNTVAVILLADPGDEITTDLSGLASSPQGVVHEKRWDFGRADQIGTESLTPDVLLTLEGKEGAVDLEARALRIDIGNDPPTLTITSPPDRSLTGVVPVEFMVFDSQDDLVTVDAFYDLLDDDPDQGFLPALGGSATGPDDQPIVFFWDAQTDVGFSDHDVALKLVPSDEIESGPSAIDRFRVDNNTEPRIEIDDAALQSSRDRRGGIPIPFILFDGSDETGEPGDDAAVVFQWKKDEQPDFPELPPLRDAGDARVFLADPELADLRRELQICTEIPNTFEGKLITVDTTTVRLPELASSAAGALERDPATGKLHVVGTLEILDGLTIPSPVKDGWTQDPGLVGPVGALPVGNGPSALVLEDMEGAWRLRSLNTATGGGVRLLAAGNHTPTALTYEPGERSVLVALLCDASDSWELRRVDLPTADGGEGQLLASSFDGATEGGPIRGLASLGREAALVTAGSSLLKVSFTAGKTPLVATLLGPPSTPLDEPWGIVVEPLLTHRVYVAESGADRILSIATNRLGATVEVPARGIGVPRPTSLALENGSTRLLVVTDTDPGDGTHELRSIELGSPLDLDGDGRADLEVYEIGRGYPATDIAAGLDGFRIVSLSAASDLAVGGGLMNRIVLERGKTAYDPAVQSIRLDRPLDPVPGRAARWRLARNVPVVGTPGGTDGVFVWSSDDAGRGSIRLRAVAFDGDRGQQSRSSTSLTIASNLDSAPRLLPDPAQGTPNTVVSADLDQDGDLDLVTTSINQEDSALTLFFQASPRQYAPIVLQHPALQTPISVATADLDEDGDLDLVSANSSPVNNLTLFFQTSPGVFDPEPSVLENPALEFPRRVVAADLDMDGDIDLAVSVSGKIVVFFQISPGVFDDDDPLQLEPDSVSLTQSLLAADLDQDGDIDLAATVRDEGNRHGVAILFQTAPGLFDTSGSVLQVPRAIIGTMDLITADLDRDGDLDLVAVGFDTPPENRSSLSLFFQTAPGTFDPDPTVLIDPDFEVNRPMSVVAADVDRDGDLDLVAADDIASKLIVHSQTSPGQFDPLPTSIDVPGTNGQLDAADLDADGSVDLATTLGTGELALYFQASPGSFDPEPSVVESPVLNGPVAAAAVDLDQDGDSDLVSANTTSDNLTIFSQTSPGAFAASSVLEDPSLDGLQSLAVADLDQDGDLDLVSANQGTDSLALFFQTSPGNFDEVTILSAGFLDTVIQVVTADMDGDGDLDLVSAARNRIGGTLNLSILLQSSSPPGTFDLEDRIVIRTPGTTPRVVAAADLDQDGNMDLISAKRSFGNDNLTLYFQTAPGVFDEITFTADYLRLAQAIDTADMDGDGDLDLVVAARTLGPDGANLTVLYQSTPGTFDLENRIVLCLPGSTVAQTVAIVDLDRDGDLDLVAAAVPSSGAAIAIFHQASPSTFDPLPTLLHFNASIRQVIVADLDQDGVQDLVASDVGGDRLAVFFGSE